MGLAASGQDHLVAARLAVNDFGYLSRGYPVELVDAEFDRRPDRAVAIARKWFDEANVAAIVDLPGNVAPMQVQDVARTAKRTVMNTSSLNSALTGTGCAPTASHWMDDTIGLTRTMALGMASRGVGTWFLVVPDDPASIAFQADATAAIESTGGRVVGFIRHPSDSMVFARPLAAARDSAAAAIGLCSTGAGLIAQIRQAREMGLLDAGKEICAFAATIRDIHQVGPLAARELWVGTGFYWNRNEKTRLFSRRFLEISGRMPDKPHAATYAAILQFLRLVDALDSTNAETLNDAMRRDSLYFFGESGRMRLNGRVMLDMGLYRVKAPDAVREPWDYYEPVKTIPAVEVWRGRPKAGCALMP